MFCSFCCLIEIFSVLQYWVASVNLNQEENGSAVGVGQRGDNSQEELEERRDEENVEGAETREAESPEP